MTYKVKTSGFGIGGICFIIFVVLKLAEVAPIVAWSWLKIILLSIAIGIAPALLGLAIAILALLFSITVLSKEQRDEILAKKIEEFKKAR